MQSDLWNPIKKRFDTRQHLAGERRKVLTRIIIDRALSTYPQEFNFFLVKIINIWHTWIVRVDRGKLWYYERITFHLVSVKLTSSLHGQGCRCFERLLKQKLNLISFFAIVRAHLCGLAYIFIVSTFCTAVLKHNIYWVK